jgi:hypothetical protein
LILQRVRGRFTRHFSEKVVAGPSVRNLLNACAERFVRGIKESCLTRMIFIGEESLRKAIQTLLIITASAIIKD